MALIDNVVAAYHLEEASGTRDDAHAAFNLTDNNTVGQGTGKFGFCASFDNTSSEYLSVLGAVSPSGSSRSVSCWMRFNDVLDTNRDFLSVGDTPQSGSPLWILNLQASLILRIFHGGGYTAGSTTLSEDTWYHLLYTYDSGSTAFVVYLNNASEISGTAADTGEDDSFYVGVGFNEYWSDLVDEVVVWSRVLTSGERAELYNAGAGVEYPFSAAAAPKRLLLMGAGYAGSLDSRIADGRRWRRRTGRSLVCGTGHALHRRCG